MNNRLVHRPLLRLTESIISIESRGVERLRQSIASGHAVELIGNHPRISDPVVIYDLLRQANTTMFAMASWHLFNVSWFHTAVQRFYGAYSINREGLDRESIKFSIDALDRNLRPVLMFPEGSTSRTNDALMPFLAGPLSIAKIAARRRYKRGLKTVIHPVAFRYHFLCDFDVEFQRIMESIEQILKLTPASGISNVERVERALEQLIAVKEVEFEVDSIDGLAAFDRRQRLVDTVLGQAEHRSFEKKSTSDVTQRMRNVRAKVFPQLLSDDSLTAEERAIHWLDLKRTYLAWKISSYPEGYLSDEPSKDRILEIAIKILEDLTDTPRQGVKQKVIVECCDAIEVPVGKSADFDGVIREIRQSILDTLLRLE